MFNFNQILSISFDRSTGDTISKHYDIVKAQIATETYDRSPDGYNLFEIDLVPVDNETEPDIYNLTVAVANSEKWVNVEKDLKPNTKTETEPGFFQHDLVDTIIEGKLLIVTTTGVANE